MSESDRITEAEAQILEDLAEMRETDREGYQAILQDLADDAPEADPVRAHAEQLFEILDARNQGQEPLIELINQAYRDREAGDTQQ